MRTLQWQKIPIHSVIGKANLWTMVGRLAQDYEMDYSKMDDLFSVGHDARNKRQGVEVDVGPDGKKKKENTEINILDGKRSLNVNIFLKQFRLSHEEIVQLVRDGRGDVFGGERLRGLLKLLPSQEEIDAINAFDGDQEKLGNAEKFFIQMMKLPNYRMRTEGLLIREEFNTNMEWIRPSIEAVIQASKDIQENKSLKELIFLILMSGNYLNSGNYAGNAAGFKLSSLLKLTEIRANKPRMNLLHYVAQEAKEKNPRLLNFPDEMKFLKDASQVSVETLSQDISNIANKVKAITEQIVMAGVDFQQQMEGFLKEANVEVVELEDDLNDIETMRLQLATFFAEEDRTFKLEECFRILQTFCERFQKAISENVQREIQEEKQRLKKIQNEENCKRNSKEISDSPDDSLDQSTSIEEEDGSIVDMLLADVRSGFNSRKFNDGNFSVQKVTKVNLLDALSPGAGPVTSPSPTDSLSDSPSFERGSYGRTAQRKKVAESLSHSPTPESGLNQRRNRRSYATEDNESLIDFLMESEAGSQKEAPKPEQAFERYGSLRRRHLERKEKRRRGNALEVIMPDRELAPSPSTLDSSPDSPDGRSRVRVRVEPGSDSKSQSLRRTRSLLDRSAMDKANIELKHCDGKEGLDSSDALLDRIKQKLSNKSEERRMRSSGDDSRGSSSGGEERSSNRWRSGVTVPETISERNNSQTSVVVRRTNLDPSRDVKLTHRKTLDSYEFERITENKDILPKSRRSQDDSDMHSPGYAVSVRKKISSDMGTDIDQVLKTIEITGRTIDTVGVSGPIKRVPEIQPQTKPEIQNIIPVTQVAVVGHVTTSTPRPIPPISEDNLKAKRDKRKKRSTLSLEDVRAAMKTDTIPSNVKQSQDVLDISKMNEKNTKTEIYIQKETGKPVAKTPPSPRRPNIETDNNTVKPQSPKELSKAAKLAAKKKFRDARFGDSNNNGRPKSNVEADGVNQALKEMNNPSSISRSKSYDDHVAKTNENGNGSILPDNKNGGSSDRKTVLRNSTSHLDGRRNGHYFPSDESDTELTPEDAGTRKLSTSPNDRPGSSGQLSLKSTNTSTETLEADVESLTENNRKNSEQRSQSPDHKPLGSSKSEGHKNTPTNHLGIPMAPRPQSTTAIDLEESTLRRSYSLMERTKLHNDDEDSDNPLAKMAKWRLNRSRHRRSFYDNVAECDPNSSIANKNLLSPSSSLSPDALGPSRTEVNDLKNEIGSRSSYASSYASSNDRDEGFETGSGTASQRTSMSSTIDSDIYAAALAASFAAPGPQQPLRRGEGAKPRLPIEKSNSNEPTIKVLPESDPVMSSLSVEAERKERTESWTEQTIRSNGMGDVNKSADNNEYTKLSPDSGHSTSKEDIWTEEMNKHKTEEPKKKESISGTGAKTSSTKTKSVPNYMKSTSSTSTVRKTNQTSNTKSTPTASSSVSSSMKKDTPQRISFKDKQDAPTLKRDLSTRASMRAESASSGFQRGTISRKSVRGPRTSLGVSVTSKANTSSSTTSTVSTRPRSDSAASMSSTTSSTSNSNIASTVNRLSNPKSVNTRRPTTPASHTSPSTHVSTPSLSVTMRSKTPINGASANTSNRNSGNFSRTQSLRVTSPRTPTTSSEPIKKKTSSTKSDPPSIRRSTTPLSHEAKRSTTPLSHEKKRSTTPLSHEKKRSTTPLSHEMKRSTTPLSHEMKRSTTPLSHEKRSTTPLPHEGSRSTTPLPERPRSSFMSPTASSKAKKDLAEASAGPLLRSTSLRMPKKTVVSPKSSLTDIPSGRKSPAVVESPLLHKGEHHQSLSTVAEQDEEISKSTDASKKSPSLLKRIGIVKTKPSTSSTGSKSKPRILTVSAPKKK